MSNARSGRPFLDPVRKTDRWLIAIVGGVAISVALFSIPLRQRHYPEAERLTPTLTIALETPTPRPTAPPTIVPTPRPTAPPTVPPRIAHRAAARPPHPAGAAQPAPIRIVRPTITATHPSLPVGPGGGGVALAPGSSEGAGSGNGAGSGPGGSGGPGGPDANTASPCGYVEFIPDEAPRYVAGTAYEQIRATVHFPDGHTEDADFPYRWVYPNASATDPWSQANLRRGDQVVHAQLPPPGTDISGYSDVIRYVLDHTTPEGVTVLHECPRRG